MQSDKKFKREPRNKTLAKDFALPYSVSVESIKTAIANAQRYEIVSREAAGRLPEGRDKKNSLHTMNFWVNVQGELKKHERSLKEVKK